MKVVSFNICCLPKIFNLFGNPLKRINKINQLINSLDADIVCLQEVFDKKIIRIIKQTFKYHIFHIESTTFLALNNGLMILSRTPIVNSGIEYFKNKCGEDSISEKGMIYIETFINNKKYMIVNTHLNADAYLSSRNKSTRTREKQMSMLQNFIQTNFGKNIILCGDFNIDFYESEIHQKFISMFNITQKEKTITYPNLNKQYDYIFCLLKQNNENDNHNKNDNNENENNLGEGTHKFKHKCLDDNNNISDHYPLIFSLNINEE